MVRDMLKTNPPGPTRPRLLPRRATLAALPGALAIALLLTLLATGAQASNGAQYGQVQRFGGFDVAAFEGNTPTSGKLLDPRGFAVDTQDSTGGANDTAVYVLDRTSASDGGTTTAWRIQKFGEDGTVLGTVAFTLSNNQFKATAIQALAVDHAAGRLYALVVGQPSGADKSQPVAQELVAWSITPNGSKQLVAAPGLTPDALGTGAGIVAEKSQLQPAGAPLYDPQGIAVDPTGSEADAPVVIEATDLAAEAQSGGNPAGNTVIQQVATSPGAHLGELLGKWSSASVASQLGGKSWGPGGISTNPDGTLTALLNNVNEDGLVYAVHLSANLATATVLDSATSLPALGDFDELPFADVDAPFGNALTAQAISQASSAAPGLVQLSTTASNTTGGLYAGLFATPNGKDPQTGQVFYFHEGQGAEEPTPGSGELYFQANLGVRLLQPGQGGLISGSKGETIVNTLANPVAAAACNFGAGTSLSFAAGSDGALWVLVQGPSAEVISGALSLSNTATGGQVVELAPGSGTACPQPSGTFTMQPAGGPSQAGNTELTVAAGTAVKFDASGLVTQGATPFAYEWQLNSEDATHGKPINVIEAPEFSVPPTTAEYTYLTTGKYKVKLAFRSDYGTYTTAEGTVNVVGSLVAPTAQFSVTTATPLVGTAVDVDASASQGGSGTITGYEWKWGDGSAAESVSGTATSAHTYTKAGPYTVELIVTNNLGQRSVLDSQQIVVAEASQEAPKETPKEAPKETPKETPADRSATDVSPQASENKTKGTVSVTLSCPATKVSCAGTLTIETANAVAAKAKKKTKRKRVVLGQSSFSLGGGKSETITLHLSSAGAKLLSKLKHLPAVVTALASDSFGDPGTQTVSLVLSAPVSAKHKKHR